MPNRSVTGADLWCFSITTSPEAEDAIAELLAEVSGMTATITHDLPTGRSTIAVYVRPTRFWTARVRRDLALGLASVARSGLRVGPARLRWYSLRPTDWRESWKRHFKPFVIGDRLLVRPSWSRQRPTSGQIEIVLDPGMSFGTGQHPTTAYCLREIVRLCPSNEPASLWDVGTGSGILAIAAARLGYRPVQAMDFDSEAVSIARRNARANGVGRAIEFSTADVTRLSLSRSQGYHVICANLTADLLERSADALGSRLEPGGHLITAGILRTQFPSLRRQLERRGLRLVQTDAEGEWQSGTFRKPTRRGALHRNA
jgi:ribosomal protein L11 methyltransferase